MPDTPSPPVDLAYSTFNAGTLSWQRDRDLLLITVRVRPPSPLAPNFWWRVVAGWAFVVVAAVAGFSVAWGAGPAATRAALLLSGVLIAGHALAILAGRLPSGRHLLIRVSRQKLLVDECGRDVSGSHMPGAITITGRAWAADEVTSVTAVGGSLRVKTSTRRLEPLSISSYDPADLAFAADAIRRVLAGGVDAWVASQATTGSGVVR